MCHRHEQMMRISENCIKFESGEDDVTESRIASFTRLTDDEKAYLKRVERLKGPAGTKDNSSGTGQLSQCEQVKCIVILSNHLHQGNQSTIRTSSIWGPFSENSTGMLCSLPIFFADLIFLYCFLIIRYDVEQAIRPPCVT